MSGTVELNCFDTSGCFLPISIATSPPQPSSPGYPAGDSCAGPTSQSMESASQSNQVSTANLVNIYIFLCLAHYLKMAAAVQKSV